MLIPQGRRPLSSGQRTRLATAGRRNAITTMTPDSAGSAARLPGANFHCSTALTVGAVSDSRSRTTCVEVTRPSRFTISCRTRLPSPMLLGGYSGSRVKIGKAARSLVSVPVSLYSCTLAVILGRNGCANWKTIPIRASTARPSCWAGRNVHVCTAPSTSSRNGDCPCTTLTSVIFP